MTQVTAWFERKFAFGFPLELYPNLLTRLRGTPARLEECVRACSRERMVHAAPGKWSAQEHAGHLLDLEPLWMARVEDYLSRRDRLTVADLSNRRTFEAGHNARALSEILRDFRQDRFALLARIDGIGRESLERSLPHPRMKVSMRLADHLFFVAEHDDHHLATICELIRD